MGKTIIAFAALMLATSTYGAQFANPDGSLELLQRPAEAECPNCTHRRVADKSALFHAAGGLHAKDTETRKRRGALDDDYSIEYYDAELITWEELSPSKYEEEIQRFLNKAFKEAKQPDWSFFETRPQEYNKEMEATLARCGCKASDTFGVNDAYGAGPFIKCGELELNDADCLRDVRGYLHR